MNLERLKQLEIMTKLGDCIANDRDRFMLPCNPKHAGTHEPMDAANVGERKIAPVVNVDVEIQVVWPNAETNTRSGE
jgi:hypothetical protein